MSKAIKVTFSNQGGKSGFSKALKDSYEKIYPIVDKAIKTGAEEGEKLASEKYSNVPYDGNSEDGFIVKTQKGEEEHSYQIVASGSLVGFLELGTGYKYGNEASTPLSSMYPRGSWSASHQQQLIKHEKGWWAFKKSPSDSVGTSSGYVTGSSRNPTIITYGNKGSNGMYFASRKATEVIQEELKDK